MLLVSKALNGLRLKCISEMLVRTESFRPSSYPRPAYFVLAGPTQSLELNDVANFSFSCYLTMEPTA